MGRHSPHNGAIYTDMLPIIDIHNGMAFLTINAEGRSVCTTIRNFELFLAEANARVGVWHLKHGEVVPIGKRKHKH